MRPVVVYNGHCRLLSEEVRIGRVVRGGTVVVGGGQGWRLVRCLPISLVLHWIVYIYVPFRLAPDVLRGTISLKSLEGVVINFPGWSACACPTLWSHVPFAVRSGGLSVSSSWPLLLRFIALDLLDCCLVLFIPMIHLPHWLEGREYPRRHRARKFKRAALNIAE